MATATVWLEDGRPTGPRIIVTPAEVEVGVPASLTVQSLTDNDVVEWDFADGATATGAHVTHAWAAPGTYRVTVSVTNEMGSSSATTAIEVLPFLPPPTASFDAPASVRVGTPVVFTDTSQGATSWEWSFGDGGSATTASAGHSYSSTGTFVVTLTVTNRNGSDVAAATIEVTPDPPVARFTPSSDSTTVGAAVTFTNTSTSAVSHFWDFGDGTTSTEFSPSHAYARPGVKTVVLTVVNSIGETDSASVRIKVNNGG